VSGLSSWAGAAIWVGAALLALYAAFVIALVVAGRRGQARAVAGFVPDCAVLMKRLAGDPRVSRRRKTWLVLLAAYLAMPFDLVPDFIPVAGQLDDAVLVAIALRSLVRAGGAGLVRAHWPGPDSSLALLLRMSGLATAPPAA
jgi:uncharacterized membrane protein YkvA (DUF1232 family)